MSASAARCRGSEGAPRSCTREGMHREAPAPTYRSIDILPTLHCHCVQLSLVNDARLAGILTACKPGLGSARRVVRRDLRCAGGLSNGELGRSQNTRVMNEEQWCWCWWSKEKSRGSTGRHISSSKITKWGRQQVGTATGQGQSTLWSVVVRKVRDCTYCTRLSRQAESREVQCNTRILLRHYVQVEARPSSFWQQTSSYSVKWLACSMGKRWACPTQFTPTHTHMQQRC